MNTNSTGKDFYSNKRFGGDYLFGNINDRKWYTGRSDEQGVADRKRAGQMDTYGFQRFKAAPTQNYASLWGFRSARTGTQAGRRGVADLPQRAEH